MVFPGLTHDVIISDYIVEMADNTSASAAPLGGAGGGAAGGAGAPFGGNAAASSL
jgi:hypothetical protein